jgi:hypothetical protein
MHLRKLLAFDSWTEGNVHLQRLIPALAEQGIALKLVHLGSWGNEPTRPKTEIIGQLDVADISNYPGGAFESVLEIERPDAVMMLSTATFAHRAFLRYCAASGVPTLHLYHSMMSVQVTDDHVGSVKVNKLAHMAYVAARVSKLVTRTCPCYIRALLKTGGGLADWGRFAYDAGKLAVGLPIWQPNVAPDARTTKCAVYNEADRHHAHRVYRLAMEDIFAVGNPDLIRFGLTTNMLGSFQMDGRLERREIVYIDTGLAMQGLMYRDIDDFCTHIADTGTAVAAQGFSLSIKLHPAHDAAGIARRLEGSGVVIVPPESFSARLLASAGCIAEPSSATLIPALLGVPMLYTRYGRMAEARFGRLLTSYPRGQELRDPVQVRALLGRDEHPGGPAALAEWISQNSGPLPASDMPRRVADLVSSMMRRTAAHVAPLAPCVA